ncbi:MAG: hypothetical protein UFA98_11055 [Ruminococcus sp.]|nr:hypothetical protein [Ruminococcus sp.]
MPRIRKVKLSWQRLIIYQSKKGFEGDRAEQSEVKTLRGSAFRESVDVILTSHTPQQAWQEGLNNMKRTSGTPFLAVFDELSSKAAFLLYLYHPVSSAFI